MTSKMLKETALDIYEDYTRQCILGNEKKASDLAEELAFFIEVEKHNMNPIDFRALRKLVTRIQKQGHLTIARL